MKCFTLGLDSVIETTFYESVFVLTRNEYCDTEMVYGVVVESQAERHVDYHSCGQSHEKQQETHTVADLDHIQPV